VSAPVIPPARSRLAVGVAFAGQGFCFAALVTRIPALQDRFDLGEGALAALLALVPVIAGVGSVTAGMAAARVGSRPVLRAYGPVVPLSLVAVGASGSLPLLVAALLVVGLGLGSVDATMNMQGVALQGRYGRSIMAGFFAVFSLAGIAGAGAAALAAHLDWSLLAFFALIAVLLVPCQVAVGRNLLPRNAADVEPDVLDRRVPWRPIAVLGAVITCVYVIDSSISNWSAVYLTDGLGSDESVAALAYAAYALTTLLGRAFADRVVRARGPVRLVRAGGILGAVGLVVAAVAPEAWIAIAGFALVGFGLCAALPFAFVAADSHDPSGSGIAVARVNVANYVGFVLGAPLVGVVAELSSLRVGFLLLVPVSLVLAGLAARFQPVPRVATG
jgi:MFS family permease